MAASSFFSYGFSYADGEHGKDILISYLDGNPFAGTTQITATRVPHLTYSETGTSSTFISLQFAIRPRRWTQCYTSVR